MLGENLQKYRKEKGLTKTQLGKKAKVHFNTIKNIEKGIQSNSNITTLEKLATALDVTVNDLIKK